MGTQVRKLIEKASSSLTSSERKIAATLLSDYPFAGLSSIQNLALRTEVSASSISRFVKKLGLSGYQGFQQHVIEELKEGQRSPVEVYTASRTISGGYLQDFINRAAHQMKLASDAITEAQFEQICHLLSDPRRKIFILGGRISDTIAQHLAFHMRLARPGVVHISANPQFWPEYLLRMKQGDVLFIIDFRRYQSSLFKLANKVTKHTNARIILMTDIWLSPISKVSAEIMPVPIQSGTLWDTYSPALAIAEAIVTRIAEHNWDETRDRIQGWDQLRVTEEDN